MLGTMYKPSRIVRWRNNVCRKIMLKSYRGEILKDFQHLAPQIEYYKQDTFLRQLCYMACRNGFRSLNKYYAYLVAHPDAVSELRQNLTFSATSFFRGEVWPELEKQSQVLYGSSDRDDFTVWCAGCSTGKETYSVLMLLLDFVPAEKLRLVATDYNSECLKLCGEGIYPYKSVEEIPEKYRHYLEKYDNSRIRFPAWMRDMIHTRLHNLLRDPFPEGFDLILCRNVIKFFDKSQRAAVHERLAGSLAPGGLLVVSDEIEKEGIADPAALSLMRIGNSPIYRKRVSPDWQV